MKLSNPCLCQHPPASRILELCLFFWLCLSFYNELKKHVDVLVMNKAA